MFIDFFSQLKEKNIKNIKTEINSPEVTKIFEKLIEKEIVKNTEE